MQKKNQAGFTLIELMIVVAIVAILAAVAIPAYQDYIVRSKVSEVSATAGACKTSVSEYYATNNGFPANATAAGCSTQASQYVSGLSVASTGIIQVTATSATGPFSGSYIQLSPTAASTTGITAWTCTTNGDKKYAPATCRG